MSEDHEFRAKSDVLAVLRRAGVGEETIDALNAALPDPVHVTRDADLLARYGITRDRLVDWRGGSP